MVPAFLVIFAASLIILFITNPTTFFKTWRVHLAFKPAKGAEIKCRPPKTVGLPVLLVEAFKLVYYRYVEAIPNYEAGQRVRARLGNNLSIRLPFGSTKYQVIADPVYAKCIMGDPSWTERILVGYYLQDAGFHKPYGLLLGGGKYWKPASRITAKLLQQLGFFNPTTMEGRFVFEMEELERKLDVQLVLNGGEHTFRPRDIFGYLSINVVFHIMLGKRNPFDEAVVTELLNKIITGNKKMSPGLSLLDIIPFLRYFPQLTFLKYLNEASDMIYFILREVIADKRKTGKYKERTEDFVDGLLEYVDKSKGCDDGLNEDNMLVLLRDMLFAGADTTSATLEYALLFMAVHPEVQEKVQAEIDYFIGQDRAPSYEDRKRMPYTEATLDEIYRVGTPIPGMGRAKHEGNKCSIAVISLYGIHRDESLYDEPNEFKPERFLNKDDPTKVVNTEHLMPFGYGRRACPGETAARVAVFIYFVRMLQKYSIKLSSRHPPPSMRNTHGFSRSPLPYYITISKRHY